MRSIPCGCKEPVDTALGLVVALCTSGPKEVGINGDMASSACQESKTKEKHKAATEER